MKKRTGRKRAPLDRTIPWERYTPERVAEFLLSSAVDEADYAESVEEVRRMGLDPAKIDHCKPTKA